MKKLLTIFLLCFVSIGLLTACEPGENPNNNLPDIDETKPYYIHMVGAPDFHGWFDYLQNARANAETGTEDIFVYHKVGSVLDSMDLIKDLIDKKNDDYVNMVFVGFDANDQEGGTRENAQANLDRNKAFVQQLVNSALDKGVILLISNGYPKTAEETDEHLLWNHEQMAYFITDFMYENYRIYMFNAKRALSDENEVLKDETDEQRYAQMTTDLITYLSLIKKHI